MKAVLYITLVLALVLGAAGIAGAEEATPVDSTAPAKAELENQTLCPVMGGKIDSTVYTDIHGQRVYHCCPMCSGKLKEDPDKYFKKAAAAGVLFENIQTTCPVSGEILEQKEVYADYEGRRVYFCCKKCRGTFSEDPQKFLTKMDQAPPAADKEKMDEQMPADHEAHDHSGHDH